MNGLDQVIISLWFLPVVLFVILPLFVGCFWILYNMFDVFKPIAGQEKNPSKFIFRRNETA